MPPAWLSNSQFPRSVNPATPSTVSQYLASQWQNPNDVLSVLLILGPDIVQKAIAQLAGRALTPVAFSFGWVAYSVSALLSVFGGKSFHYTTSESAQSVDD